MNAVASGDAPAPGLRVEERSGVKVYIVEPGRLLEVAEALRDAGYDMLLSVSGVDEGKEIRLVYHFTSTRRPGDLVALETRVPMEEPRVPSLAGLYPAALYQERETYEMLGVVFEGHPDLRRLLLPEDWPEGVYPLRRSFRVAEEPWMSPRPSSHGVDDLRPEVRQRLPGAGKGRS